MSDPENFIERWSRRKRAAAEDAEAREPAAPDAQAQNAPAAEASRTDECGSGSEPRAPEPGLDLDLDLAKLPPLESITAETDIRAYLAPGVPAELTRAALRRVWSADPQIRDFVGLSENSWDFNDPDAVAGFGRLEITDEIRREIERMVGGSAAEQEDERPAGAADEAGKEQASLETTSESAAKVPAASQRLAAGGRGIPSDGPMKPRAEASEFDAILPRSEDAPAAPDTSKSPERGKRSHGGALPGE